MLGRLLKKGRMTASQWVMPAGMKSTPATRDGSLHHFLDVGRRRMLGDLELPGLPVLVQGDDSEIGDQFAVLMAELNEVGHVLIVDAEWPHRR